MPVYMEISRLHRTVTIVARGKISPDEIRGMAQHLAEAQVRPFAKIIEAAGATTEFTPEHILRLATLLRGAAGEKRGPIAFVVHPDHTAFPQSFATLTQTEGPISLFTSLREARGWVERTQHGAADTDAEGRRQAYLPWSDPQRRGVYLRGTREREVTVKKLDAA